MTARRLAGAFRNRGQPGQDDARVTVRRFPYPFRAMLAISNDIDMCSVERFREVHRFLNTREQTSMGAGLGLDVGDSMWFYRERSAVPAERTTMSYFNGYDWTTPSASADEILHYLRTGWIDSVHAYGNFSAPLPEDERFGRRHAEEALAVLAAHDLRLKVWINHGNEHNSQNVGPSEWMEGDRQDSPAYHWDLTSGAGTEFVWTGAGGRSGFAQRTMLSSLQMADGSQAQRFDRFSASGYDDAIADGVPAGVIDEVRFAQRPSVVFWHPRNFHAQLSERHLQALIDSGGFAVLAQHFGHSRPLLSFGPSTLESLRRLAAHQARGDILVARTERLLEFNRARDCVRYAVREESGMMIIDIEGIDDPARGLLDPDLERIRGLTFYVPAGMPAELRVRGHPLPREVVQENQDDGTAPSIGVAWFEPDYTDHTVEARHTQPSTLSSDGAETQALERQVLDYLDAGQHTMPEGVSQQAWDYAVSYTRGRYAAGLADYDERLRKLGFSGFTGGLDIGSGAGHWCLAFARRNGSAEGIDNTPSFVEIANRIAGHTGYADRVRFQIARAEELPFPDASFPVVWTHSVFQFVDVELALAEVSRVLYPRGFFYCGYSSLGFRIQALQRPLMLDDFDAAQRQVAVLVGQQLYEFGLHGNRFSMVRAHSLDHMIAMAAATGFEFVDEPGLQDARASVLGFRGTADLLVRRERGADALRNELSGAPLTGHLRHALERLVAIGCPRAAVQVAHARGEEMFDDPGQGGVYLRALIKAGEVDDGRADRLDRQIEDPLLRGLLRQQRHEEHDAVRLYESATDDEEEKPFLIATSLFALDDDEGAREWLERGAREGHGELACSIGLMAYASRRGDLRQLKDAYSEFVQVAARLNGAEAQIEEMLNGIA